MEDKYLKELKDHVADVVRLTVNGKIDKLVQTNKDWQDKEGLEREKIKLMLTEYIVRSEPSLKFFEDINASKRVFFWIVGGFATVGGAWIMIKQIFH